MVADRKNNPGFLKRLPVSTRPLHLISAYEKLTDWLSLCFKPVPAMAHTAGSSMQRIRCGKTAQPRCLRHILSTALTTTPITMKSIIATKTSVASSSVPCLKKNADIAMLRIAIHIPRPMIRIPVNIWFHKPPSRLSQ
jgi:hypothetical protein